MIVVVSVLGAVWIVMLVFVVALCKAAAMGDAAQERAGRPRLRVIEGSADRTRPTYPAPTQRAHSAG